MDSFAVLLAARAPGRHAGDAHRRRRARRVACDGCWHHQLRDRDRHRIRSKTREPHSGRSVSHDDAVRPRFSRDSGGGRRTRARPGRMAARRAALVPRAVQRRRTRARLGHGSGNAGPRARAARRRGRRIDLVPELLASARATAPPNASFVEGDAAALPFEDFSFDLTCSRRTLHHVSRPELVFAEMARVTKPGGRVFVDDQLAPRIRSRRSSSTASSIAAPVAQPTLADGDLRDLFASNGLTASARAELHAAPRPRLLPRPRGLHRRGGRAREGPFAGRPPPLRRGVRLVPLRQPPRLRRWTYHRGRYMPPRRAIKRATVFGATACRTPGQRYQRGTVVSLGGLPTRAVMCRATSSGSITHDGRSGCPAPRAAESPRSRRSRD